MSEEHTVPQESGENMPLKRKMKVYDGRYNYAKRFSVPMIRLHSNLLLRYNFKPGDSLEVTMETGQITIKKVKGQQAEAPS